LSSQKRFIESDEFPVEEISKASSREKEGPGGPLIWRMIFWWTRKPLISARSIIAGSLLPAGINIKQFGEMVKLEKTTPHKFNPSIPKEWQQYFANKKILDPFAGFGSIPLESLRLGLDTTCIDLLPPADDV
jgi:putative DNA methylase